MGSKHPCKPLKTSSPASSAPYDMELRSYQRKWINDVARALASHRAVLGVLPTGAGKTVCFSHIAQAWPGKVLVVVHRRELLAQSWHTLLKLGIRADIIAPGAVALDIGFHAPGARIAVGSVQSIGADDIARFGLIIVDEAHHTTAEQWSTLIQRAPESKILGVTATPCRTDDKGLGDIYQAMVLGPTVADLILQGHLCPIQYRVPQQILEPGQMVGQAIEWYRLYGRNLPGVYFARSVADAITTARIFTNAGIPAAALFGAMPSEEREQVSKDIRSGALRFVMSNNLISEGYDCPDLGCAILGRRTESQSLHLQQLGRIMRQSPGKSEAVALDLVGNCLRLGIAEEHREWSLRAGVIRRPPTPDEEGKAYHVCAACNAYYMQAKACPRCGWIKPQKARKMILVAGELVPYSAETAEAQRQERKREEWGATTLADWRAIAIKRGYNVGWAYHRYRQRQKRKG